MKILNLAKAGLNKIRSHHNELKANDLQDSIKSVLPGEWCCLKYSTEYWVAFVNPLVEDKYTSVHVLSSLSYTELETFKPETEIPRLLSLSFLKRQKFINYDQGSREFYGSTDGLPGLLIDSFVETAVIQINTAGVDKYRDLIKHTAESLLKKKCYFLDNLKYREKESLPTYNEPPLPPIEIRENGISYKIRPEVLQKVGFYYDHRENRQQLLSILSRIKHDYKIGIDLFCYVGAWGLNALKGGVQSVEFVDQGDFQVEISNTLSVNGFNDRGIFHRSDVFKFLDSAISQGKKYDVLLCDPPAFAKSPLQKQQALDGYSKLHRKVLKIASKGSVIAFSSCTHYVSHEEFQKNIVEASYKEDKKLQLLHMGIQGFDHPISNLSDRSNYIKSYIYILE